MDLFDIIANGNFHDKPPPNDFIRCNTNWQVLETFVNSIVQEKMIELKEEVKDEIRREILNELKNEETRSNALVMDDISQCEDLDEDQVVLLDETNVDDVAEVLDSKGRGRSASYLVRWSTGGYSRVKVNCDSIRERFKRLRRRYWNRYQAEKEKASRLEMRRARDIPIPSGINSALDIDYSALGVSPDDENANRIIRNFLQMVADVGTENALQNSYC